MSLEQYHGYKISKFYCNLVLYINTMIIVSMNFSLQSILAHYISADWLQHTSHSWIERCQSTNSAESVELLKEVPYNFGYPCIS